MKEIVNEASIRSENLDENMHFFEKYNNFFKQ